MISLIAENEDEAQQHDELEDGAGSSMEVVGDEETSQGGEETTGAEYKTGDDNGEADEEEEEREWGEALDAESGKVSCVWRHVSLPFLSLLMINAAPSSVAGLLF